MCCCLCPDFSPHWDAAWCPTQRCNNSHQHTALQCEVLYLISFQEFIFFARKQVLSGGGTHSCTVHLLALFFPRRWHHINLTYACDRTFFAGVTWFAFCRILFRQPKGKFLIPIKAESYQSAFYQQHQMLLRVFFKLKALIACLGLISWSVSLCKQETVFMLAVT